MFEFLFSFNGRANRLEYIMFFVLWTAIFFAYYVLATSFNITMMGPLYALALALWISSIAITVRRLHDMDLSGWVYIIVIVAPYILVSSYGFLIGLLRWDLDPQVNRSMDILAYSCSAFTSLFYLMLLIWPGRDKNNRFH